MTPEQFDNHGFTALQKAIYKGGIYDIVQIDFEERLIGIDERISGADEDSVNWKRCENIEIVKG